MDQLIGKTLNHRYQIQSLIGRQTGRRTFLAQNLQTGLTVVIKLLLFAPDFTWEDLKLFEREAAVLRSLNHPAIPQYLDDFEVDTDLGKGFALVQSYIEARSLQDWTRSGRTFSEAKLRRIARELLCILNYLHTRQPPVVHRDLKPSNILLSDRTDNHPGKVYLVDFGSVQTASHYGTRTIVGTYGYMPPEQFGGQTVPASDLYALGATLIGLASGQSLEQLPQREMRIMFDDQVNLSPDLIGWLKWLTEPSLDQRLRSAHQALEALKAPRKLAKAQPAGSRVQLKQTRQTLEIVIPTRGFNFGLFVLIVFAIAWNSPIVMWFGYALMNWSSGGWIAALFGICHLAAGLWMSWLILFELFGRIRLKISESKIFYAQELFGVGFFPQVANRRNVSRIDMTHGFPVRDSEGDQVRILPQIQIWAGTTRFILGSSRYYGSLTPPEVDWLAEHLNRWLKLPVVNHREEIRNASPSR